MELLDLSYSAFGGLLKRIYWSSNVVAVLFLSVLSSAAVSVKQGPLVIKDTERQQSEVSLLGQENSTAEVTCHPRRRVCLMNACCDWLIQKLRYCTK